MSNSSAASYRLQLRMQHADLGLKLVEPQLRFTRPAVPEQNQKMSSASSDLDDYVGQHT